MLIVDSQAHVWTHDDPEAKPRHGDRPYSAADVLVEMRCAGVDRAFLVPPYWVGSDNGTAVDAAERFPDRFRVMGRFDITVPDPAAIAGWKASGTMLGIRLTYQTPELQRVLNDEANDWFWAAAEAAELPVMVYAPGALPRIAQIARAYPRLRLAIDHMGIARVGKDEAAFAHIDELVALAALPNISVKLSTLPIYSSEPYPHPRLHPFIRRLCTAYGPERLFWGSDLSRLPCSYRVAVDLFVEEFRWLSASDLDWIMGRAVCEWSCWASSSQSTNSLASGAASGATA